MCKKEEVILIHEFSKISLPWEGDTPPPTHTPSAHSVALPPPPPHLLKNPGYASDCVHTDTSYTIILNWMNKVEIWLPKNEFKCTKHVHQPWLLKLIAEISNAPHVNEIVCLLTLLIAQKRNCLLINEIACSKMKLPAVCVNLNDR